MKRKSQLLALAGMALLSLGAAGTGAVISQSTMPASQNAPDKHQGALSTPQLSRSNRYRSNILPGIEPLAYMPAFIKGYTSPIWHGKSQRPKHFNKKRHGKSLRRKHKKTDC